MIFAIIVVITRLVVIPLEEAFGSKYILTSPCLPIWIALRLACGGLLLGLSVVARYIGPQSVVRCSSSPLMVDLFTKTFRNIFGTSKGSNRLMNLPNICKPDDVQKPQLLEQQRYRNPRRLQLPISAFAQIAISILIAVAVAYTTVIPFSRNGNLSDNHSSMKLSLILLCITSSTMQLLLTTFSGTNHEIDPTKYQSSNVGNHTNLAHYLKSVAPIMLPLYVLTILIYTRYNSLKVIETLGYFVAVPPVIVLYLSVFDYTLRRFFCTKPHSIKKLVEQASGGDARIDLFLDVVLRSLLHSDDELVKKIGSSTSTRLSVWMDIEQEEQKRNDSAVTTMANILLHKTNKDEAGPHLEDDVLRLAILSSIGGPGPSEKYLVGIINADKGGLSVCRALCAYFGGLGKALLIISEPNDRTFYQEEWVLPPGAIFMGECAIRGATRWILHSLDLVPSSSSSSVIPRSITSLEILIPVLLSSAFTLENGLVRFAEAIGGPTASNETDTLKLLQTVSPQLLPLFNTCNDCARMIIMKATAKEGLRQLNCLESLDADCQKWLRLKNLTN
mmetsp:Transcript_53850/g.61272  ORF Transcript_53850/g.61272 Transcript_53850/m.61272 type:complete len:560 (+) Transcript_53850:379-2058(+)